jgi:Flp pilus assembly protein TadB
MSFLEWLSITVGLLAVAALIIVLTVRMIRQPRRKTMCAGLKNVIDAIFGIG